MPRLPTAAAYWHQLLTLANAAMSATLINSATTIEHRLTALETRMEFAIAQTVPQHADKPATPH